MGFRLPKPKWVLRREAAGWLARLQSDRDPDIGRKFEEWRNKDRRNAAAVDHMRGWFDRAGVLRHSPVATPGAQGHARQKPDRSLRPALAAAAAIVILVPVGVVFFRDGGVSFAGTDAVMLMTSVGEIKQVELADGSKVTLDTATKVEVEVGRSHRMAHLKYGRARFQIVQADEPFVVETDSTTISTNQGVIDVEQIGQNRKVDVLAGAVDVRGPKQAPDSPVTVGVGRSLIVSPIGDVRAGLIAPAPDWTRGMLQFDGAPLAEAVALANRYSDRQIILVGDLGALRVTGAFRAGDTTGLAKALAAAFSLSLQQRSDGDLVLARSAASGLRQKKGG